jgi:hypothetical protein
VPVGVPPDDLTVAVRFAVCPEMDGFGEDVRVVVVGFVAT